MTLTVKVTASAGDSIEDTALEMRVLANRILACVECRFNDVALIMPPRGSADKLVSEYHDQVAGVHKIRMAFG